MKSIYLVGTFYLVLHASLCCSAKAPTAREDFRFSNGLVVEEVQKNAQAQAMGVHPGDILLTWKRGRICQDSTLRSDTQASFQRTRDDLNRSIADVGLTREGRYYLGRLLYSRNEAKAVIGTIPKGTGMLALDFAASRRLVISSELANYRIVHFATHGILDNRHPELSGLVLSLVDNKGKQQAGFLKLQDIYNLKLPVDLVVLSGCETGLGEQINGEGLIGLTRGFMSAGAIRVIASLWKISDMATSVLMADFYNFMQKDGMTPAAALRAAQVRMWKRKQWSAPFYWAAFQIQGEWR